MRRWGILLALLALGTSAPAPARVAAPHPALWRVSDPDTTIYLLGTIHVLPRGLAWRDARIDRAIGEAQSLTLEVVIDRVQEAATRALARLGTHPGLPPLVERVPAARRPDLARLMREAGLPDGALDGYETWAAAVALTGPAIAELGLGTTGGVEEQVTQRFRAAGKPIDALETAEAQLSAFDGLGEAQQRAFLLATLDPPGKSRRDYQDMLDAWLRGDLAGIARSFARDPEFTPELREALIRRRNRAWTEQLARRMARPGTVLVAVGAGHLVGPDAVQAMLARRGFRVTRVR